MFDPPCPVTVELQAAPEAEASQHPVRDAQRCVHSRCVWASCQACVKVCPRAAWRQQAGGPALSPDRCDACGLCLAVCPTGALTGIATKAARRTLSGREVRLAACERVLGADCEGRIPCLHALGLTELLESWREGCGNWVMAQAPCDGCPRGQGERLQTRIARLNELLRDRSQPTISLRAVPPERWLALLQAAKPSRSVAVDASRRRWFGLAASPRPEVGGAASVAQVGSQSAGSGPGTLLPGNGRWPWSLEIDPEACQACHACAQICPSAAIVQETWAGTKAGSATALTGAGYRLEHARCTGCGLCVDVCPTQAVRLQAWSQPRQTLLDLRVNRCARCGATYAWPVERTSMPTLCPVCVRGQHRGRLYQVMD